MTEPLRSFWNVMPYRCDHCGYALDFYLEEGCEGPREIEYDIIIQSGPRSGEPAKWWKTKTGRRIVPVPFVAGGCPQCQGRPPWEMGGGVLQHSGRDRDLVPMLVGLPPGTARFHYPPEQKDLHACGIPIYPPYCMT